MSKQKAQVRRGKHVPKEYRDPSKDWTAESETYIWTDEKGRPLNRTELINYDTSDRTIFDPMSNIFGLELLDNATRREIEKLEEKEQKSELRKKQYQQNLDITKEIASFLPIIGDAMDGYQIYKDFKLGNYSKAGFGAAMFLLPNWLEKGSKYLRKVIPTINIKSNYQKDIIDFPFDFKDINYLTIDRKDGIRIGYNTSGIKTKTITTDNKYWKENITDPNNIPPRELKKERKTVETTKMNPKLKEILNPDELFIPLGTKVDSFNPDEFVNLVYKDVGKHVNTYIDPNAPITETVKLFILFPTLMANPVGTNRYLFSPSKNQSYVYQEIITPITYTLMHKQGGQIPKFQNSGKIRKYTNPFFKDKSPLNEDLQEGVDYVNTYPSETSIKVFKDNLWENENPDKKGYKEVTKTWSSYSDGTGRFVGPGIDYNLYGTKELINSINNGKLTNNQLNSLIDNTVKLHTKNADKQLAKYTNYPDTISPQIKAGFYDVIYLNGPNSQWSKLAKAIAEGNLNNIHEQSKTYITKNGEKLLDERRWNHRKDKFFHY